MMLICFDLDGVACNDQENEMRPANSQHFEEDWKYICYTGTHQGNY